MVQVSFAFKKHYPQGDMHMVGLVAVELSWLGLGYPVVALVAQMGLENTRLVGPSFLAV